MNRERQTLPLDKMKWLLEHLEYYAIDTVSEEAGADLLDNIKRYGEQIYTYPMEAMRCYAQFQEHLENNPYVYMSGLKSEEDKWIKSSQTDGYLLEGEDGQLTPAALLAGTDKETLSDRYERFLRKKEQDFRENVLNGLSAEIENSATDLTEIYERWKSRPDDHAVLFDMSRIMNVVSWIGILLMFFTLGRFQSGTASLGFSILLTALCVLCTYLIILDVRNRKLVSECSEIYSAMQHFIKDFQYFKNQQCTISYIMSIVKSSDSKLPLATIQWKEYDKYREYLSKIAETAAGKLFYVNNNMVVWQGVLIMVQIVWQIYCIPGG